MVGRTERELTEAKIPFEIGVSRFAELAKSQITGGQHGMLKLLFHRDTFRVLGVHCIGESATEIIHIGQMLISFGGCIDYFCNAVFNHPTFAESYKIAAFDGLNRVNAARRRSPSVDQNSVVSDCPPDSSMGSVLPQTAIEIPNLPDPATS